MSVRIQKFLLQVWRRVPVLVRRWIVRLFAPSFTVGAACAIEREDGALLLVRVVYRDGWGLPGGLVNRREAIDSCARREVREETGLAVDLVGEPAVVVAARPQRIDVVYRARPAAGADADTAAPRSPEVSDVRWFPAQALPELQPEAISALVALARSDVPRGSGPLPVTPFGGRNVTRATGSG
ncbi:MAG TPA: NUDIX domain-containing protein [Acidimicrobiales bacterium]|nr:NUDIX domain-containing protein [Acidimicrobiales bacterium]